MPRLAVLWCCACTLHHHTLFSRSLSYDASIRQSHGSAQTVIKAAATMLVRLDEPRKPHITGLTAFCWSHRAGFHTCKGPHAAAPDPAEPARVSQLLSHPAHMHHNRHITEHIACEHSLRKGLSFPGLLSMSPLMALTSLPGHAVAGDSNQGSYSTLRFAARCRSSALGCTVCCLSSSTVLLGAWTATSSCMDCVTRARVCQGAPGPSFRPAV